MSKCNCSLTSSRPVVRRWLSPAFNVHNNRGVLKTWFCLGVDTPLRLSKLRKYSSRMNDKYTLLFSLGECSINVSFVCFVGPRLAVVRHGVVVQNAAVEIVTLFVEIVA